MTNTKKSPCINKNLCKMHRYALSINKLIILDKHGELNLDIDITHYPSTLDKITLKTVLKSNCP